MNKDMNKDIDLINIEIDSIEDKIYNRLILIKSENITEDMLIDEYYRIHLILNLEVYNLEKIYFYENNIYN